MSPRYRPRTVALTIEGEPGEYWTPSRCQMASSYQFYVYRYAADLLGKMCLPSLIDIGCGYPIKAATMLTPLCAKAVVADQPTLIDVVRRDFGNLDFLGINLEKPNLDLGEKFDVVVCADVLEHLLDPDPCMEFIARHLSSDGIAILSTPERDIIRGPNCFESRKPEHIREWNRAEFARFVETRGFRIINHVLTPTQYLPPFEYWMSRVLSKFTKRRLWSGCQMIACRKN